MRESHFLAIYKAEKSKFSPYWLLQSSKFMSSQKIFPYFDPWYICKGILKIKNWFLIESDSETGKITILIFVCLNVLIMRKEGWWLVCWIRAEGGYMRVEGTVWNTLKGGGTEKRGGETKILKRRGQAGSRCGCLKRGGGGWNPLTNNDYTGSGNQSYYCKKMVNL